MVARWAHKALYRWNTQMLLNPVCARNALLPLQYVMNKWNASEKLKYNTYKYTNNSKKWVCTATCITAKNAALLDLGVQTALAPISREAMKG